MIAIYSRQSVDKKDSISIESQIDFCKREFTVEDYKIYTDKGFSGKNTNRPAFEEMINDVKTGMIKQVIVYKLDRISRSTLDFANIINIFKKHDVDFISSTEKFDTASPIGKAMLSIIMVFAELERDTIQKRIKDNYYARGKKGFFMGGRVPYGFVKIETRVEGIKTSTFENDYDKIPHIIKLFELYANSDMSLGKIKDYINSQNIPSSQGGKWDSSKISKLLRSSLYVKADADVYSYYKNKGCIVTNDISEFIGTNGCYVYGKRESNERRYTNVENHVLSIGLHSGVIDSKTWLLCQYKLDGNKQVKNSGKGKHSWLSGIVKCGYCGYAVCVTVSEGYKYFRCKGKTNLKACNGHSKTLYVNEIESIIEKFLLEKMNELRSTKFTIQSNEDTNSNKFKLQILEIDNQIENLLNQISESNNVVIKYINDRITSLDSTKNTLIEEMKKNIVNNSRNQPIEEILNKAKNWDELSLEDKKKICGSFIEKIRIKDDEMLIDWKI